MALITLLTDFGYRDSYVASLKAKVYSIDHTINVVDISHDIDKYDIQQAAFIFNTVYKEFPIGTVHLLGVERAYEACDYLIIKTKEGLFIAPNNGILSLLEDFNPLQIIKISRNQENSFVLKNELIEIACRLSLGQGTSEFGVEILDFDKKNLSKPVLKDDEIIGIVVFVDSYGNLITNIHKDDIEKKSNDGQVGVKIGREYIKTIETGYKTGKEARCIALFNSNGYLEIAMTAANASKLLGVKYESVVTVNFKQRQSQL